jgi:hypothetical protein
VTGQTSARQIAGDFGFRGHDARGFSPFSRRTDGRYLESGGVEFAGRSPPRDQYEIGRGRSFESQRVYGLRFLFRGTRTPPMRQEWSSHGGSSFDRLDRMDRYIDRHGRMNVATLLSRKWPDTGLPLLELTSVLSHLLALALGFELQVGGPENIWLISGVVLRPHTLVVTWRYITFGDGGQGRENCDEMIKVSQFVTFKCVALVKPLGLFCSLPYLMCIR